MRGVAKTFPGAVLPNLFYFYLFVNSRLLIFVTILKFLPFVLLLPTTGKVLKLSSSLRSVFIPATLAEAYSMFIDR
jgi:hypothetical protein